MELKMEMGNAFCGVAGVANPPDELAGRHQASLDDPISDTPTLAIGAGQIVAIGVLDVIIEMDVSGEPTATVVDAEVAAIRQTWTDPGDCTVAGCEDGDPLGGHDVDAFMTPWARRAPTTIAKAVGDPVFAINGKGHRIRVEFGRDDRRSHRK
jgi:hypothetical protein